MITMPRLSQFHLEKKSKNPCINRNPSCHLDVPCNLKDLSNVIKERPMTFMLTIGMLLSQES